MHASSLNILCTDGAVHVTFAPPLNAEQYAELLEIVRGDCSIAQLRQALREAETRWDVQVTLE